MKKLLPRIAALAGIVIILLPACRPMDSAATDAAPDQPGAAQSSPEGPAVYVLGQTLEPAEPPHAPRTNGQYPVTEWDALVPEDWDPVKAIGDLDFSQLSDSDPRAMTALRKLQDEWKNAPANSQLDNLRSKIAGFVVPLDAAKGETREFLLVPYFGACIHTPPPPSNQVIHVVLPKKLQGLKTMDAIWVSGVLTVERSASALGAAGYAMRGDLVETYAEPSAGPPR